MKRFMVLMLAFILVLSFTLTFGCKKKEEAPVVTEPAPTEQVAPAEEPAPTEQMAPAQEAAPAEQAAPPAEPAAPAEAPKKKKAGGY